MIVAFDKLPLLEPIIHCKASFVVLATIFPPSTVTIEYSPSTVITEKLFSLALLYSLTPVNTESLTFNVV